MRYLGHGVSGELQFTQPRLEKLARYELPELRSFDDFAAALEIAPSTLKWLAYRRQLGSYSHYAAFHIPKRTGGTRKILAPKNELKRAQRWILKNVLERVTLPAQATAYCTGRSTLTNAEAHVGQAFLIKLDIKEFFPSITFIRVRGLFKSLGYSGGISTVFSLLTTSADFSIENLDGKMHVIAPGEPALPQGAPTSPAISNLICRRMDHDLAKISSMHGLRYSRYSDDMSFSSASRWPKRRIWEVLRELTSAIHKHGFAIQGSKTRFVPKSTRQTVTGIVVNEKCNLSRDWVRRFRTQLHYLDSSNLGFAANAVMRGKLSYLFMANPASASRIASRYSWLRKRPETYLASSFAAEGGLLFFHRMDGLLMIPSESSIENDCFDEVSRRWARAPDFSISAFRFRDRTFASYRAECLLKLGKPVRDPELLRLINAIPYVATDADDWDKGQLR